MLRPRWKCKDKIILLLDSTVVPSFSLANTDGATITYHFVSGSNYFYLHSPTTTNARADAYTTSTYPLTDFSGLYYILSAPVASFTTSVGVSSSRSNWMNTWTTTHQSFDLAAGLSKAGTVDISSLKAGNYYIGVQLLSGSKVTQLNVLNLTLVGRTYS